MFEFEIVKHIAEIGGNSQGNKQLNIVSWNKAPARLDLRSWREDENGEQRPNKGMTLTKSEAQALYNALGAYLQNGQA